MTRLAAVCLVLTFAGGCASPGTFTRTDARTCLRSTPARVCFVVDVDRGERLVAGTGTERLILLPGECAEGSASQLGRAGLRSRVVRAAEIDDGKAGQRRIVPLAPGHVTQVRVRDGKRRIATRVRACTVE